MVSLVSAMELLGDTRAQGWATLALRGLGRICCSHFAIFAGRTGQWCVWMR
jgi:hypothetical protein